MLPCSFSEWQFPFSPHTCLPNLDFAPPLHCSVDLTTANEATSRPTVYRLIEQFETFFPRLPDKNKGGSVHLATLFPLWLHHFRLYWLCRRWRNCSLLLLNHCFLCERLQLIKETSKFSNKTVTHVLKTSRLKTRRAFKNQSWRKHLLLLLQLWPLKKHLKVFRPHSGFPFCAHPQYHAGSWLEWFGVWQYHHRSYSWSCDLYLMSRF